MLRLMLRTLTFRLTPEEYDGLGVRHLLFGLVTAWVVGYGRWWDRPDGIDPLHSGLLSVVIVLGLGLMMHIVTSVLHPKHRGLLKTTAFVSFTSLPAALYALPLESWMALGPARLCNVVILAVVATWRVALYVYLLKRIAKFDPYATLVTALFPLSLTLFTLTTFGVGMTVIKFMTGHQDAAPTSTAETRYEIILLLGVLSLFVAPIMLILWLVLWFKRNKSPFLTTGFLMTDQQVPPPPPHDV